MSKEREGSRNFLHSSSRSASPSRSPLNSPKDLISMEPNIANTTPTRTLIDRMERKPLSALQSAISTREKEREKEREQQLQIDREVSLLSPPSSSAATSGAAEEQRSPSPERPFQGVSRLIDQWQKKSEEGGGGKGSKTTGAGTGAGSRFRREGLGITAGGPGSKTN